MGDGLRSAVVLFMQGNARRRRVKRALQRRSTLAPALCIELDTSRARFRRLRRLHDAPFGEALFKHLIITRTFMRYGVRGAVGGLVCMLMVVVCAGAATSFMVVRKLSRLTHIRRVAVQGA